MGQERLDKHSILNLKVPDSKKDLDWYKAIGNYYIPSYTNSIAQYKELKKTYEFVNNDLSGYKDEIEFFCNPMGDEVFDEVREELKPFNKLHNKINVAKGELLQRTENIKVTLLSPKAIEKKDKLIIEEIKKSIDEKISIELETLNIKDPKQKEQYIQQERTRLEPEDLAQKKFTTEQEIFCNKALKYCHYEQSLDLKKGETMEDALIADRFFTYSGWKHGKPYLKVINPLYFGFHKSPNERYVQKGDYAWYKKSRTLADIITDYGNQLTDAQIEDLISYSYTLGSKVDSRHNILDRKSSKPVFSSPVYNTYKAIELGDSESDKRVGKHQGQHNERNFDYETLIWETHIEFKGFKEIIFLAYYNEYNKKSYEIYSKDFEIPKESEKISYTNKFGENTFKYVWTEDDITFEAEKMFIPWRHEMVRLGDDIYLNYREVPLQPVNLSNPFSNFELSYKGCIINSRNAKSISSVQRAIPSVLQFFYIKHIQLRELAKYQGYIQDVDVDQIPLQLGQDKDGNDLRDPVATWSKIRRILSVNFYSGSQNTLGGLPPSTRSPGSKGYMVGTAIELVNLQNLLDLIDREIGLMMGFSPQREAMFSSNTNASDNQRAINQSHHITEPLFHIVSEVWKITLNDWLNNFKTYCKMRLEEDDEVVFHYFLEDGTEELLRVTSDMVSFEDIGLFISDSRNSQKYMDMMLSMSQAIAQNAGEGLEEISTLIKAITSKASPEEVHKMISLTSKKQRDRLQKSQMEQQEAQAQAQERLLKMQDELKQDMHEKEKEIIMLKESLQKDTKLAVEAIKALGYSEDKDVDNDGQLDVIEVMKAEQGDRKLQLEAEKLKHQKEKDKRDQDLKEKEILQKNKSNQ